MNKSILFIVMMCCLVPNAISAAPRLLFESYTDPNNNTHWGMADPRVFIFDQKMLFSGTYKESADDARIHFFGVPLANLDSSNIKDNVTKFPYFYSKTETNASSDVYTNVMSGFMFLGVNNEPIVMWSARQNWPCSYGADNPYGDDKQNDNIRDDIPYDGLPCSEAETGFQAVNNADPIWINIDANGNPSPNNVPHSHRGWTIEGDLNEIKKIRMPSDIFHDDTNNDGIVQVTEPQWNIYNYYSYGNHIATWQWKGNGAQAAAINLVDPKYTWGCVEGGIIFKRGSYYYLVYSTEWYNAGYNIKYKKAMSVESLASATEQSLLNAYPENGTVGYLGEKYWSKNVGNADVLEHNGKYYIVYHVATPTDDDKMYHSEPPENIFRRLYIDELNFGSNGNINTLNLP